MPAIQGCECDHCRDRRRNPYLPTAFAARLSAIIAADDPTPVDNRTPGTILDDEAMRVYDTWNDDQRALVYQSLRRDGWNEQRAENQRHRARSK